MENTKPEVLNMKLERVQTPEIAERLRESPWEPVITALETTFEAANLIEAIALLKLIAKVAAETGVVPEIRITANGTLVHLRVGASASFGFTEADFDFAASIDNAA